VEEVELRGKEGGGALPGGRKPLDSACYSQGRKIGQWNYLKVETTRTYPTSLGKGHGKKFKHYRARRKRKDWLNDDLPACGVKKRRPPMRERIWPQWKKVSRKKI